MAERKDPKPSTIKALFARSGNQCAYPGCQLPLVDELGILTGQICHINSVKKQDARWDDALDAEYLRSYDNLILMCNGHHKRIDTLGEKYTVSCLKQMRRDHEDAVSISTFKPGNSIIAESIYELTIHKFVWDLEGVANQMESLIYDGVLLQQQSMDRMQWSACMVMDAQLHFLYLKALCALPKQNKLLFIEHHEAWKEKREKDAQAATKSHGGTLAPLEFSMAYSEDTRRRIQYLRTLLDSEKQA